MPMPPTSSPRHARMPARLSHEAAVPRPPAAVEATESKADSKRRYSPRHRRLSSEPVLPSDGILATRPLRARSRKLEAVRALLRAERQCELERFPASSLTRVYKAPPPGAAARAPAGGAESKTSDGEGRRRSSSLPARLHRRINKCLRKVATLLAEEHAVEVECHPRLLKASKAACKAASSATRRLLRVHQRSQQLHQAAARKPARNEQADGCQRLQTQAPLPVDVSSVRLPLRDRRLARLREEARYRADRWVDVL
eukprot:PLAT9370.1.p1 GENE.PLAT9370.1~~PLAT9370.1.p1  ORF type:complete len:256 (-),score=76.51 PLAT9370.1:483-1250(-)